jgi:glutamate mutase epsilon subunit
MEHGWNGLRIRKEGFFPLTNGVVRKKIAKAMSTVTTDVNSTGPDRCTA